MCMFVYLSNKKYKIKYGRYREEIEIIEDKWIVV